MAVQTSHDVIIEMANRESPNKDDTRASLIDEYVEDAQDDNDYLTPRQDEQIENLQGKGCVTCRKTVKLTTFSNGALVPGNHIRVRGKAPRIGRLYYHHAIVKNVSSISEDGQTAEVTVIEVNQKRKLYGCFCDHMIFNSNSLAIDGKTQILCNQIEIIDYTNPFHDNTTTLQIAERAEIMSPYCCLFSNCENAVTACISADAGSDEVFLSRSISVQTVVVFKKIFLALYIFILLLFLIVGMASNATNSQRNFYYLNLITLSITIIDTILLVTYISTHGLFRRNPQCTRCFRYYIRYLAAVHVLVFFICLLTIGIPCIIIFPATEYSCSKTFFVVYVCITSLPNVCIFCTWIFLQSSKCKAFRRVARRTH